MHQIFRKASQHKLDSDIFQPDLAPTSWLNIAKKVKLKRTTILEEWFDGWKNTRTVRWKIYYVWNGFPVAVAELRAGDAPPPRKILPHHRNFVSQNKQKKKKQ